MVSELKPGLVSIIIIPYTQLDPKNSLTMSRNARNDENGEKSPASGDLNWMPEVAPWRLAILAKNASGLNGENGEK